MRRLLRTSKVWISQSPEQESMGTARTLGDTGFDHYAASLAAKASSNSMGVSLPSAR